MKVDKKRTMIFSAILSYLTLIGITIDLQLKAEGTAIVRLLKAMGGFSLTNLFLFVGLCTLYICAFRYTETVRWTMRERVLVLFPAGLFAGFMVVGYSFAQTNSLDLVLKGNVQRVKALIAFAGYGLIFAVLIAWFYTWLSTQEFSSSVIGRQKGNLVGWYTQMLLSAPFRTTFLTLLILYIPYAILSCPGIFMGDVEDIIKQGFNFSENTSNYLNLLDENVKLNGHHPVMYTEFVHACLILGNTIFGSYNIGILLVSLTQLFSVCAVVALSIQRLAKAGIHENILLILIAYFAFAPRIQNYMFLITKDVLAACVLLSFSLIVFQVLQKGAFDRKELVTLSLSGIAMSMLRNEGKYIILGSIVLILVLAKEYRKMFIISGAVITIAVGMFFDVLMPSLHITSTSKREALSVPFQQTARYFRDYPDEITPEEYTAISAVLDAETIGEKYNPTKSDLVKSTYRELATKEELIDYFKVWLHMGLKHPGTYVQATLNNYYNYFYPDLKLANQYSYSQSAKRMKSINADASLQSIDCSFSNIESLNDARLTYEALRERLFEIPVLSLLKSPAAYVWSLILLVFYLIKEKAWKALALTTPLVLSVGVCFLGPCNGEYFRYLYCVSVCLPVVLVLALYIHQKSKRKEA